MEFLTINPSKSKLLHGEFTKSSDFETVLENGFFSDNQWITLDCNGFEVVVNYELTVEGHTYVEKGDYFTPGFISVGISNVSVSVTSIEIDEYEVELNEELTAIFEKVVKELI